MLSKRPLRNPFAAFYFKLLMLIQFCSDACWFELGSLNGFQFGTLIRVPRWPVIIFPQRAAVSSLPRWFDRYFLPAQTPNPNNVTNDGDHSWPNISVPKRMFYFNVNLENVWCFHRWAFLSHQNLWVQSKVGGLGSKRTVRGANWMVQKCEIAVVYESER